MTANGQDNLADGRSLAELERRTYRTEVDDGLWDLLLGLFLLVLGFSFVTGLPGWLPILIVAFGCAVRRLVRTWLIEPRIGLVRLSPDRMVSLNRGVWVLAGAIALLLAGFLWVASVDTGTWHDERRLGGVGLTLLLAIPIAVAAYWFEIRRFYAYAGLVAFVLTLGVISGHPAWAILVSGAAIVPSGGVVLARFLGRYHRLHTPVGTDA